MSLYIAIPKATHAIVEVATGTAIKTLLQVATPSTTDIRVLGWGISFDGIVATNPAGVVTLVDVDVAATVTSLTPEEFGSDDNQASLCVGGTAATGYLATAEGTIGGSRILDGQNVHPQTGYALWFPSDARPKVKASRFLRIRALFSVDINGIPWIVWQEPA
jgi:hypothetical protein